MIQTSSNFKDRLFLSNINEKCVALTLKQLDTGGEWPLKSVTQFSTLSLLWAGWNECWFPCKAGSWWSRHRMEDIQDSLPICILTCWETVESIQQEGMVTFWQEFLIQAEIQRAGRPVLPSASPHLILQPKCPLSPLVVALVSQSEAGSLWPQEL